METALAELIDAIKLASPVIWEAAVRQALVDGMVTIIVGVILLTIAITCGITLSRMYKLYSKRYDDRATYHSLVDWTGEVGEFFLWTGTIIPGFVSIWMIGFGVKEALNPNWYAIQSIIGLVIK